MELSRTHVGPAVAIACCTLFGFLMSERKILYWMAALAMILTGISTIMYTGARGALASALVVCFCVALYVAWNKRRMPPLMLASLICAGLFFAVQAWVPDAWSVISLRLEKTSFELSDYDRIPRWLWSLKFFYSHPMGVGWTLAPLGMVEQAHNDLLIMAMSFGIFGLLAYVMAFKTEWVFLIRTMRAPSPMILELCLPSFACLLALFVCGSMDMMLAVGGIFDVSWLMVVLARANRPDEGKAL